MAQQLRRLFVLLALAVSLLASSCSAPVELVQTTAEPADARVIPAGFADQNAGSFLLATPREWWVMQDKDDVSAVFETAGEQLDLPFGAARQFESILNSGHALVAVNANGDNVNAFRLKNQAGQIGDPDENAEILTREMNKIASNVQISSSHRVLGDHAGLYTKGTYVIGGQMHAHLYQFAVADGNDAYFVTVTLTSGPNRDLADKLLGTFALDNA